MLSSLGMKHNQDAFDSVKSLVCSDTTLCYFNVHRPVIIQVDVSKKGLVTALLQDGCPVAFASKVLTPPEQCYGNIECMLLTCIFGAEQFCTYVFGHEFTIESDTNPLNRLCSRIWQMHQPASRECCYASRTMTFVSNTDLAERCS